jgi:hypothetical protein
MGVRMQCPECHTDNPEVAQYCARCGNALHRAGNAKQSRSGNYAVQSGEGVGQLALISTIMPHTNRRKADNYRWALMVTGALVLFFTLIGSLSAAVLAAAFVVPVTYIVYIYDVNLWEETPLPVIAILFIVTGILSLVVSLLFFRWLFDSEFGTLLVARDLSGIPIKALLIFAVLLPIVAEIVKNAGAIWLARNPLFDDQIDALTFGIAAGTAYAAFETVVAFAPVFSAGGRVTTGLVGWLVVILNLMIVKSLIYGTATGLALSAFSGRGEGYDGFQPKYYKNFGIAVGANVAYWLGVRLLAQAPFGHALGLLWGFAVAALLILKIRAELQSALLEAAVEDAAQSRRSKAAVTGGGFCPECEVALLPDAVFCIACGSSVRATSGAARRHIREETTTGGAA